MFVHQLEQIIAETMQASYVTFVFFIIPMIACFFVVLLILSFVELFDVQVKTAAK